MQRLSRRMMMKKALAFGALSALPIGMLAYHNNGNKYSDTFESIHQWYMKKFFNFDDHFSPTEKEYFNLAIELADEWTYKDDSRFSYSLLSHSQRIIKGKANSSRVAVGSFKYNDKLLPLVEKILFEKKLTSKNLLNPEKIIGLGWDIQAGDFKLYWYDEFDGLLKISGMESAIEKYVFEKEKGLASLTFNSHQLVDRKIYVPNLEPAKSKPQVPFKDYILHENIMLSSKRGAISQWDLKESGIAPHYFPTSGQNIIRRYKKDLNWNLDTVAYNSKDDFTLYF